MTKTYDFTKHEGDVLFALTLAWCENIHVSQFSMSEQECETAEALKVKFTKRSNDGEGVLADALAIILTYYSEDLGEGDLEDDQWDALEALHARLSAERGHIAKNGDGEVIAL